MSGYQVGLFDAPEGQGPLLSEARREVVEGREDGISCPCCDQYVRVYRRKLNKPMARLLLWLVRRHEKDPRWYNVHEFPLIQGRRGGGDFAKLAHWGLVEEGRLDDEDGTRRTSGIWVPTSKARQFVAGALRVPSHVHLYNNHPVGFSDTPISIRDALGEEFSYADLMGREEAGA